MSQDILQMMQAQLLMGLLMQLDPGMLVQLAMMSMLNSQAGRGCGCNRGSLGGGGFSNSSRSPGSWGSPGDVTRSNRGAEGVPNVSSFRNLSAEQKENARIIIEEGRKAGASDRDIQIGLMTAMQESGLRNLRGGDRDSAGLFQQRPSCGWGSFSQVTDPHYAARTFFLGTGGNRGLLSLRNRDQMSLTQAAQAVQRSAFPNAYAKHEGVALALLQNVGGGGNGTVWA